MNQTIFLQNKTGQHLYQTAKDLPIVDYHCHLSPREIWEDCPFDNLAQLWLSGDHYKWRLMRAFGIDEHFITCLLYTSVTATPCRIRCRASTIRLDKI